MQAASYAEHLFGQGKSAKTVTDYQREINYATAWGLDLATARPEQLLDYAATRPNTPGIRGHMRSAFRYWWEWKELDGWPRVIKVPKAAPMVCKALTDDEAKRLCRAAWGWWRPGTAVLIGTHLGLRNEEIAGMRWDGFDTTYEWYTLVGKSNRQRTVAVPGRLSSELAGRRNGSPFVFEGRFGGHVSHTTVWNWIRQVADNVGIDSEVWPHRLRHTFGAVANDETRDLRAVQAAMGHARPETTAGYTRATATNLRKVADAVAGALE